MRTLDQAKTKQTYVVEKIEASGDILHHLQDLGMKQKAKVSIVTMNKDNAIVLLHRSRIALDKSILKLVTVKEIEEDEENWLPLADIVVGNSARVVSIHGLGEVKRRLMDMGITRGTSISVKKVAPLGDPIEVYLRGYNLTLRKSEAEMVLVTPFETQGEE